MISFLSTNIIFPSPKYYLSYSIFQNYSGMNQEEQYMEIFSFKNIFSSSFFTGTLWSALLSTKCLFSSVFETNVKTLEVFNPKLNIQEVIFFYFLFFIYYFLFFIFYLLFFYFFIFNFLFFNFLFFIYYFFIFYFLIFSFSDPQLEVDTVLFSKIESHVRMIREHHKDKNHPELIPKSLECYIIRALSEYKIFSDKYLIWESTNNPPPNLTTSQQKDYKVWSYFSNFSFLFLLEISIVKNFFVWISEKEKNKLNKMIIKKNKKKKKKKKKNLFCCFWLIFQVVSSHLLLPFQFYIIFWTI